MAKHIDRRSAQLSPPEIDIQIELWPIERLIPRINNPRTHSSEQISQIAASIKEFGWTNPILVDEADEILAGHARVLAAKKFRMEAVPVIVLRHLTDAQKRALVIADNQLALNAGWDETALRAELEALRDADYELDILGFEDIEPLRANISETFLAARIREQGEKEMNHDRRSEARFGRDGISGLGSNAEGEAAQLQRTL